MNGSHCKGGIRSPPVGQIPVVFLCFHIAFSSAYDASLSSAAPLYSTNTIKPIDPSGWPHRFTVKEHCSKCDLCVTSFVVNVTSACAFLGPGMARIDDLEEIVHGRRRNISDTV
jgi:hypothetical protein